MLVYHEILERVKSYEKYEEHYDGKAQPLIINFNNKNLQSVAYDVTMDSKVRRFKSEGQTISLDDKGMIENLFEEVEIGEGYYLKPNEYVLVKLKEKIYMPNDLAGHIRPRTTLNRLGLILTAQHINPSYSGYLQLGIHNQTPHNFKLTTGLTIGQIVFEKVDSEIPSKLLYKNVQSSKYNEEDDFVGSKIYDENTLKDAQAIFTGVFDRLEKEK